MNENNILDHIKFTYRHGDCLTENEMKDFIEERFDAVSMDDINYHVNRCQKCQKLADAVTKEHIKRKFKT